ncbi:MAG: hypothetical protein HGB18_05000 [Candidatus Moranbacteria bacterium]|nr:hypothetical protein [Candidatus Moranbacteria bacterium]
MRKFLSLPRTKLQSAGGVLVLWVYLIERYASQLADMRVSRVMLLAVIVKVFEYECLPLVAFALIICGMVAGDRFPGTDTLTRAVRFLPGLSLASVACSLCATLLVAGPPGIFLPMQILHILVFSLLVSWTVTLVRETYGRGWLAGSRL